MLSYFQGLKKNNFMKINAVRAMLIVSLVIILLYILGLFLPIILNTKKTEKSEIIFKHNKYLQTQLITKRYFN